MRLTPSQTIVRLERAALEAGHVRGRIVATSAKLVAVAIVSDEIRCDGFNVFRRADISKLTAPDPYAEFVVAALRLRGNTFPRARGLDLTSWHALVRWACLRYPLVTIHLEARDRDACYIGRPTRMTSRTLTLATIAPDAVWHDEDPLVVPWADVTQVGFGGAYEDALALVAREREAR